MALKVGLQVYSVRQNMAKNPIATVKRVAEIGYKYLETANLRTPDDYGTGFGVPAKDLKKILSPFATKIFSAHIFPLDMTNIDKVLDYFAELDTKYIHSKPPYGTVDDIKRQAELHTKLGEKCRAKGMRYGIHSGVTSYCEDGTFAMDRFAEFTSPGNVLFELDTYWILRSGEDPVELIKRYKDRIHIIHQKDLPREFKVILNLNEHLPKGGQTVKDFYSAHVFPEEFCEIGTGSMDLQKIIDTALEYTKAENIILEQDYTQLDEFDSIQLSMNNFKKFKGLQF
jgi:sugar phosphate isomerase/epimerase